MTWQIFLTVRVGDYRLQEVDITPALGVLAVVGFFLLLLHDPSWGV